MAIAGGNILLMTWSLLLSLLFLVPATADYVSKQEFVNRYGATAATDGSYLYIDGGTENIEGTGGLNSRNLSYTLTIPLTSSWTNDTVSISTISKSSDQVIWSEAVLWWDKANKTFYQYGGEKVDIQYVDYPDPQLNIWTLTPDGQGGGEWKEAIDSQSSVWDNITRPNGGLHDIDESTGIGYYLAGFVSNWTSYQWHGIKNWEPMPIPGLVIFDTHTQTFQNKSSAEFSEYGYAMHGTMEVIPTFGDKGILVMFGGDDGRNAGTFAEYEQGQTMRDMSNITVYDIANNAWYTQTATGDVPVSRVDFCTVAASDPDSPSYEIYMLGGYDGSFGTSNDQYNTVYVLSLPSFVWTRASNATYTPRALLSCVTTGKDNQMMIVGGYDPTQDSLNASAYVPDSWTWGIGVLNMSSMSFQDSWDANATRYKVPDAVSSEYSSSSESWTNYTPSNGWTTTGLGLVMRQNSKANASSSSSSSTSTSTGTSTSTATASSSSDSSSSNLGPILGGVLGGLCGICIILVAILFFLKRLRRKREQNKVAAEVGDQGKYGSDIHELSASWQNQNDAKVELPGNGEPNKGKGANELDVGAHNGAAHELP
ncbi:MAG: hypothetical protein M1834_003357 [Cirrosporium novae-zelandiae]|nr:MAG: hypothetical protein M1834_003357 [Cirrosporium novae-zelandiae]